MAREYRILVSERSLSALIDGEAVRLSLSHLLLPTIYRRLLTAGCSSLLSHILSVSDMSQSSSSIAFQALFNAALQDFKDKTGNTLTDHPIAKQLETCESVSSIAVILLEQAQSFHEFRENDGKLMKALNSSVDSCARLLLAPPSTRQSD
jgi:hypothetical protein